VFLGLLIVLEILVFVLALVIIFIVSSLTDFLRLTNSHLHEVLIEISDCDILQNIFKLFLTVHFQSASFEVKSSPNVVELTRVEFH
jgi:hypothetical protein